jgi:hypothetical protein
VRAAVLLLFAEAPEHGYDLLPKIRERIGTNCNGAGMYRALRKLERRGTRGVVVGRLARSWPGTALLQHHRRGLVELDAHADHLRTSARLIRAFSPPLCRLAGR